MHRLVSRLQRLLRLERQVEDLKVLAARSLLQQQRSDGVYPRLADAEFKVFSQFGDDGIIQYLLRHVAIGSDRFIELGVEDYTEANTRFLLINDNWRGLVVDADRRNIEAIRRSAIYWRHELTAVCEFVDRETVDEVIAAAGFAGPIGLLSIDIDGNDYWVWDAMSVADPAMVVIEYNSAFGTTRAVTIPYQRNFRREKAHASGLYWGASLKALVLLAERKGYAFVGSNSAGNNAYFVKRDRTGDLPLPSVEAGHVVSRFRESRGESGELTYLSGPQRLAPIADLPLLDVETGKTIRVAELIAG